MLLKAADAASEIATAVCFSTLYRVDAIEGRTFQFVPSYPALSFSTLYRVDAIEGTAAISPAPAMTSFSTLYRVDAIEGPPASRASGCLLRVSVPSIGSMLLKAEAQTVVDDDDHAVSVPSIGSMLLKALSYRKSAASPVKFQYPLSGRCY